MTICPATGRTCYCEDTSTCSGITVRNLSKKIRKVGTRFFFLV